MHRKLALGAPEEYFDVVELLCDDWPLRLCGATNCATEKFDAAVDYCNAERDGSFCDGVGEAGTRWNYELALAEVEFNVDRAELFFFFPPPCGVGRDQLPFGSLPSCFSFFSSDIGVATLKST